MNFYKIHSLWLNINIYKLLNRKQYLIYQYKQISYIYYNIG